MSAIVRFWVAALSLVVSLGAIGYLFLAFLFPEMEFVSTASEVLFPVTFVGLVFLGTFVWAAVLGGESEQKRPDEETGRGGLR